MLDLHDASPSPPVAATDDRGLVDLVQETAAALGCTRVWAREDGQHVLLGFRGDEAFARLTPLRGAAVGLAFRKPGPSTRWEPLFVVDELAGVVEHALVAVDALPVP
jgi:hypothetical protein